MRDTGEDGNDDPRSYATGFGDLPSFPVQAVGTPPKDRPVKIPANLPPGDYEIDAEIWPENKIGKSGVETHADTTCATFTVD